MAAHCDECKHGNLGDTVTCGKGHKPKFYLPRNVLDTEYGWKRVCGDFERRKAEVS